ncbi:MBL fold metallo-hydrolase [Candidatus Stoquefichus massiliensis]|uniref:MBL fold metallo-hydrolase n=1 Tax=Candidatus Stoquefichus massiliensis TaxID=1470350 RepID=UPI0004881BEE|nr:MBL fold metallo-hydrolase [Candidatus Stoquefichus massiliensis]
MEITQFHDIYILDDGRVREFLIVDKHKALLIDTGFQENHIYEEIKKITNLPIQVILTHGDGDHRGGVHDFKECYMHHQDHYLLEDDIIIYNVREHDHFMVGKYDFEVIEIPGHTPGSIALLDRQEKLLISGDTVQVGPIYMFGERRDLNHYIQSLQKLHKEKENIDVILPSHHQYPLTSNFIDYCLEDVIAFQQGKLKGIPHPTLPCQEYQGLHVSFYI